jgi:GDP-L-fucose synthase
LRDFIHVEDGVDGVLMTIDLIEDAGALNLSTGIYTSFMEFARMAAEICGYHPEVVGMLSKPSGVFARGGDCTKQQRCGFRFKISLREGIERAMACFDRPAPNAA